MSAIHVRRWRSDDEDWFEGPGLLTGTLADLTMYDEPADDGLVMPDGSPIPRQEPKRRPMGFLPPDRSVER